MHTYAEATQNKKQFTSAAFSGKAAGSEPAYVLQDNRPQAVIQQKLADASKQLASAALSQPATGGAAYYFKDNRPQATVQRQQANALADKQQPTLQKKTNTTGLPDQLKSGIESLSGHSMDDVKVHYNSAKPAQLQAHAYAQGTNIHIASGQEKHLPHEAWHVVQQKQGRVMPTMQLKGKVNVNDDTGLEKEADVMGAKALQLQTTSTGNKGTIAGKTAQLSSADSTSTYKPVVQRFVTLTEGEINTILARSELTEENMDLELTAEYLQTVYIRDEDQARVQAAVVDAEMPAAPELQAEQPALENGDLEQEAEPGLQAMDEGVHEAEEIPAELQEEPQAIDEEADTFIPGFYFLVCNNIPENLVVLDGRPERGVPLYISVDTKIEVEETNALNVVFYKRNETTITIQQLVNNMNAIAPGGGAALFQQLGHAILAGGVQEDAGNYGAIEFRFKNRGGRLYVPPAEAARFGEYENLDIRQTAIAGIAPLVAVYNAAGLPYSAIRAKNDYLFIEQPFIAAFDAALQIANPQQIVRRNPQAALADPGNAPLPAAPIALNKTRHKEYRFRATRGSRGAGQKAAMGNMSAHDYAARYSQDGVVAGDWEWLHIQGSRLGGPNRPENLVAGTYDANSHMIPYERAIFELSAVATAEHPVDVTWTATLRQLNNVNTHIGNTITITVVFPQGAPADTEHVHAERIRSTLFPAPVVFHASDAADFTKLDRDEIDRNKNP